MNIFLVILSAFTISYAADPAVNQTTEKETKNWIKDHLSDLSESDITELGTSNKMVCGLIKIKESYSTEPFKHKARFVRALNFECAVTIAEKTPNVLDVIFSETSAAGRRDFFTRLGLDRVCPIKTKFSQLDGKLTKSLDEVCKDYQSRKAEESKNSAVVVQASITAVFITSVVVIALA